MDQNAKGEALLAMHQGPDVLVVPSAWDVASAVVLEQAGFPALSTTSAGIAHSLGFADGQMIGRERMLEVIARITERLAVPLTTDLEAGYGNSPDGVAETIRLAIEAGSVGANLEDGDGDQADGLIPLDTARENIGAARAAADASGVRFVVNGRTDPFLFRPQADPDENFAEAVRRGNAFREAGADCVFVPGPLDADTIGRLARAIDAPLHVLAALSGYTAPPLAELRALGVRRVSTGGSLALATLGMVRRVARELQDAGTFDYGKDALTNAEMNTLLA